MKREGLKGALAAPALVFSLIVPMAAAQEFVPVEPLHILPELRFGLPQLVTPLTAQGRARVSATRPKPRPEGLFTDIAALGEIRPRPRPEPSDVAPEVSQLIEAETAELLLPQEVILPELPAAPEVLDVALRPLQALATAGYRIDSFDLTKRDLLRRFFESEDEAQLGAALELVQLHMAHMLLPEARDFHRKAQSLGVQNHASLHEKWRVQSVMLDVLQQKPIEEAIPEGWPEVSLWVLAGGGDPKQFGGEIDLLAAVSALQNHSEPVISLLLPKLFNKAIAEGDLRIADGLLRGAKEATSLEHMPVYDLMKGRLAQAYGLHKEAFDHYAKAAQGSDIFAQHGRIAMADLALERKDPKLLPDLRDILLDGVNQWRHGYEGLILRARLAQVAEDLGDIPLALDIMGRIRQDHPNTPEAVLAHERGALALAAFAVAAEAGEINLPTYLSSLREVEAFYRLDPVWPIARAALANAYSREGLHEAAAAEYAALRMDLARLDAPEPIERVRVAIPLAEAEERLVNHNISRAREALALEGRPRDPELAERYHLASLRAGLPAALSEMPEKGDGLFDYAQFARRRGDLERASSAHRRLADHEILTSDPAEALEASLLAYQRGDNGFAAAGFFALRQTDKGAKSGVSETVFEALVTPMPSLLPLSRAKSEEMLERSQSALEAVRDLLKMPLPYDRQLSLSTSPIERLDE